MPNYGKKEYWDKRYKTSHRSFDWLEDWKSLKGILGSLINKKDKILNIGCGNATITEEMYDEGYENIVNMDISPIVIEQMKQKNASRTNMIYEVGDMMNMKYENDEFDVILDKSKYIPPKKTFLLNQISLLTFTKTHDNHCLEIILP